MHIPDFQTVMLPLLKMAGDGKELHIRDAISNLAAQFGLTEEEKKELLPSGIDRVLDNRIAWARTHLKKAGLINYPKPGYLQLTERGRSVLAQNPPKIGVAFLKQFPEYVEFITPKKSTGIANVAELGSLEVSNETPEETLAI